MHQEQPAPFDTPDWIEAQNIGSRPVLASHIIIMTSKKITRRISRGLRIGKLNALIVYDLAQEVASSATRHKASEPAEYVITRGALFRFIRNP